MNKLVIIPILFFCFSDYLYSQRIFEYKTDEAINVFIDKDPEILNSGGAQAGVTISCVSNIPLTFETNIDKTVDVYNKEQKGAITYYYLRFIVGRYKGSNYIGRELQVLADNFIPLKIKLDLQSGESKIFEIFDPNVNSSVGCFYQHFNEAADLYKKAMYKEAQEKYRQSMDCADYQNNLGVLQKIETINSIIMLRDKADYFFNVSNYKAALDSYQKIIIYNSDDQYANGKIKEALDKYAESCNSYFNLAENYFNEGKYDDAIKFYDLVLTQSCSHSDLATSKLAEIKKIRQNSNPREKIILYEIAGNAPFGISAGKYEKTRISGYFSIRTNMYFFKGMSSSNKKEGKPEINISVGATKMVYDRTFVFAGIGYTGVGDWYKKSDDNTMRLHPAISPEVGVLYKIGPVALRYTFQYRVAFEKDYHDYIGRIKNIAGIGYCF